MAVSSPASLRAEETGETVRLAVRGTAIIALTENPSTGYRWSFNAAASTNLAAIGVSDAGFTPGASERPLVGAPGQRRFRIVARQAGRATAVFDYARSWEHVPPVRRHVVTIEIAKR